ncbi:MAG TPA: UDP-3-O-(3-hydroxymyristoyl)glucosamine N-acyltransferase [Candidatus Hydrogenedentes bacterium]|nr:UDP-3-O-(3-hydroxymyristoyl)glucosamine N-acyltransferase [Candidatus Hydrogenedentota bacterium]HPG68119.1 UDP-3-O-(3-hydroxymyristoyl)glucosamine N-acyltransferase [Candidatus Hydrogenedentota bacterium]
MDISAAEIAQRVGGTVIGDGGVRITGVNGIKQAGPADLTFVRNARYEAFLSSTRAAAVLVPREMDAGHAVLIQVDHPDLAFAQIILEYVDVETAHPVGIHPTAVVGRHVTLGRNVALDAHVVLAEGCSIDDGVVLYSGVYIGRDAQIGAETIIYPNATILDRVLIGKRCTVHAGAVLGADGFGFAPVGGVWRKIPQVGSVSIGDDVEIGANTTIDRATFGITSIGSGTKIDNLVQIGHNVQIGEHCALAGKVGIAGSATIGNHVVMGARSGVGGHIDIGDGVQIGALSGVTKSIEPGKIVSGYPATDHERDKRHQASVRILPEALRRLRALEQRCRELEERVNGKAKDNC